MMHTPEMPLHAAKAPYAAPQLTAYGSIQELTATKKVCNSNDFFGAILNFFDGLDGKDDIPDINWNCATCSMS